MGAGIWAMVATGAVVWAGGCAGARGAGLPDMRTATVFAISEGSGGAGHGLEMARQVRPDVMIRAWFKWAQAPRVADWKWQPEEAHRLGMLYGGGITCSALYDAENGLTRAQTDAMATRAADGSLVDAWGLPGVRHGSLSSPDYRDYLFHWCKEQIDAGADYLFMDEHTAALSDREGYDDLSLADFRRYLAGPYAQARGWSARDSRWQSRLGVELGDTVVCPDGAIGSLDYRAYLRKQGLLQTPTAPTNRLHPAWVEFRRTRDDVEWRELTNRIRAYGRSLGRRIYISANGIAPYVDLQVLGVWDRWTTDNGHVDLRSDQIPVWRSLVRKARAVGGDVPVVFFHDWGTGTPPFPFLEVPPAERAVWMRTRGAEIYAAGGCFAFPMLGPFGCDSSQDGTLPLIARLSSYYRAHRALYHGGEWLGSDAIRVSGGPSGAAAWWRPKNRTLALHVINRDVRSGKLMPRATTEISLPIGEAPVSATVISPDFEGERPAKAVVKGKRLRVTLPQLEAYSVVLLRYRRKPALKALADPVTTRLEGRWERPARSEFEMDGQGNIAHSEELIAFLQGKLHTELRNPPTFTVHARRGDTFLVHVKAVATAGARLQFSIDGRVTKVVDLPDRDGKNDANAAEYDLTIRLPLPLGRHRVTLDNVGGDWAYVEWVGGESRVESREWAPAKAPSGVKQK